MPHVAVSITIFIEHGIIKWNGVGIDERQLAIYLSSISAHSPRAYVILDYAPNADCALVQRVRQEMNEILQCRPGMCGEGPIFGNSSQ